MTTPATDTENYAIANNTENKVRARQCIAHVRANPCGQNATWWGMNRAAEMGYACNLHLTFMLNMIQDDHEPVFTVGRYE